MAPARKATPEFSEKETPVCEALVKYAAGENIAVVIVSPVPKYEAVVAVPPMSTVSVMAEVEIVALIKSPLTAEERFVLVPLSGSQVSKVPVNAVLAEFWAPSCPIHQ